MRFVSSTPSSLERFPSFRIAEITAVGGLRGKAQDVDLGGPVRRAEPPVQCSRWRASGGQHVLLVGPEAATDSAATSMTVTTVQPNTVTETYLSLKAASGTSSPSPELSVPTWPGTILQSKITTEAEVAMHAYWAVPNTDAGDGSYWWVYIIAIAALIGGAYRFYVNVIKKK